MKFTTIAVMLAALTVSQAVEVSETKDLLILKKQELLSQLTSIDGKLRIMTPDAPPSEAKVEEKPSTKETPKEGDAPPSNKTPLIVGGVVVLLLGGGLAYFMMTKKADESMEGGKNDDLYTKFVDQELNN